MKHIQSLIFLLTAALVIGGLSGCKKESKDLRGFNKKGA